MQAKALELRENFYWAGILDSDLRVFDIIMYTEFGTTYNSYLYKAGDKTILFETAKAKFFDQYIEELKNVTDVTKIDYLIVNHTEPDHAGSVEKLLDLSPQLKIIGTGTAIQFLENIVNRDFVSIATQDEQEMKLGNITLKFLHVPNLHWPDTQYTYIEEEQILVTCDSFGSHYAFPEIVASRLKEEDMEGYWRATKYYFDNIIGPFKPYMLTALDRVRQLPLSMVCTGHGPVLDSGIENMLDTYQEWCTVVNPNEKKTVVMPYVSAYGYTGILAEEIAKGIRASGDIDVRTYDMVTADASVVAGELGFADGILFGTPTIIGEALKPIWDLTTSMFAGVHGGKLASAFGSYGWSGEGVPHIIERLKQLRMNVVDGFRVRFKPGTKDLIDAFEYGYNFGCLLQTKKETKKASARTTLVKCLVCGEIFDSSLEVCPVCGVGKENFVPVEEEIIQYSCDTDNEYLVLGGGSAALNAAKAIRDRDRTGKITIITNEDYPAYNRPMLTKALISGLGASDLAVEAAGWYAENGIKLMTGVTVTGIDTAGKEVSTAQGDKYTYTKLIYAVGSECFIPSAKGYEQPEVVAIRRISDTEKVRTLIESATDAVVIGGGVLGLEAAWSLKKAHLNVTVLELAPKLMGRQLDTGAAEMLKKISESEGINIYTGVQIEEIEGDGHVTGVRLGDGRVFPAQLVIVSCGVRANAALAKDAGIEIDRAVIVNSKMETNIPDVYACGDCAQFNGINYANWTQAVDEGKVAGANAAGDSAEYAPVPPALSFHGMNTAIFSAGDNGTVPGRVYKTVEFKDDVRNEYEKYYFYNGRLCGAILIGSMKKLAKVRTAVENSAPFAEVFPD